MIVNKSIREQNFSTENDFKKLYKAYAASLKFFAYRYLSTYEDIDDILQDTFISLWKNRDGFNSEKAVKAYLYTTVKNNCLNNIRHKAVKNKHNHSIRDEDLQEFFLDNILEAEVFKLILDLFNELPPVCKDIYTKSLSGMSHIQIAEELNISVNTIKRHKNKANNFLRGRLKNIISLLLYLATKI